MKKVLTVFLAVFFVSTVGFSQATAANKVVLHPETAPGYAYNGVTVTESEFEAAYGKVGKRRAVGSPQPPDFYLAETGFDNYGRRVREIRVGMGFVPQGEIRIVIDGEVLKTPPMNISGSSSAAKLLQPQIGIVAEFGFEKVGLHVIEIQVPGPEGMPPGFYFSSGRYGTKVYPVAGLFNTCFPDASNKLALVFQVSYLDIVPPDEVEVMVGDEVWGKASAVKSQTWKTLRGLWVGSYVLYTDTASLGNIRARGIDSLTNFKEFHTVLRATGAPDAVGDIVYPDINDTSAVSPNCNGVALN